MRYPGLLLAFLYAPLLSAADDLDQIDQLLQTEFRNLSEDLGAATGYKAVTPAEPLGVTGFDIGLVITATDLDHSQDWQKAASSGSAPGTVVAPKLQLHKGLPLNLDIGGFYTSIPDTNVKLWGAELRYAILEGGLSVPAVAIRGSYSTLSGVDQLDFATTGLDLSISKGFAFVTPYGGVGTQWVSSDPTGTAASLNSEDFSQNRFFVGMNLNFGLINFALEADSTESVNSYSAKAGFRF
jgi:hypothetical protein